MNKKPSIPAVELGTPKGPSRNVRTLSQNSSSGSSKSKLTAGKMQNTGKENLSENIQFLQEKVKTNEPINQLKGLKKIKQRALGESKPTLERETSKITDKNKIPPKQAQKSRLLSHGSSKSLLSNKNAKTSLVNQSQKKSTTFNSQKSTPKSIPKKTQSKRYSQDIQSERKVSRVSEQIQTEVILTVQTLQTPKYDKQQINKEPISKNLKIEEVMEQLNTILPSKSEKKNSKELMISMFHIQGKLAEGTFSTTFQVVHIETGFLYCLKVFEKAKIKQQGLQQQIVSEVRFRRKLRASNMQRLFAVFDDEVYVYFVQEFVIGFGLLEKDLNLKRKLSQKQSGLIFKQVFEIVRAIHSENYIHRDIRIQNLAKCFGVIKLVDFSWIACLRFKKQRDTFCGTYKYAPPELLEGENYDESIDIWSLGILLYELSTGQSPFKEGFTKRNSHSMNFPIFLSNELVDLIGRLLSQKGTRMRIEEILMHEWANKWELDGFVCKEIWDFWVL